jgi:predicted nucleic acid-binding protein
MTPALIDSDVLIEVLRGRNKRIVSAWTTLADSGEPVFVSPVSVAEVWAGARQNEREAIAALFGALETVPVGAGIGEKAGQYLRSYRASHGMELGDALIAATASLHGLFLWTRNRKHFPMRELHFFSA